MNKRFLAIMLVLLVLAGSGSAFAAPAVERSLTGSASAAMAAVNINVQNESSIVRIMNDIVIPAGETVNGDVVAILGDVRIDGAVNGNVVVVLGDIDLNNTVQGDVVSVLGEIRQGPNGKITGSIIETNNPGGFNIPGFHGWPQGVNPFRFSWGFRFFNMVVLFGLAALTLALLPSQIRNMAVTLGDDAGRKLLVGFVAVLLVPALFFVSLISLIGIPLIPVIVLVLVSAKFIGYVAVALFVGIRIKQTGGLHSSTFLELFLGVLVLWLVRLVPVVGWISALVVTMFALGLVLDTKFGTNSPWFRRKEVKLAPLPPAREPVEPPQAEEEKE